MAERSASLMIASITGWKPLWPNITAPSMSSSDSSLASDSTISTASPVPATTRSSFGLDHLVDLRVEDEGAVDQADPRAADRAHEGHAGKREGGGRRDHRHDVGIVLEVMAEDGDDDLRLAAETVGEERADRAVDEAGGERLLLARPALALEEAAGDLARGEGLLLVVHGKGEEVDPRLLGACRDHGREHRGLAIGGEHGAVGLAGDPAGFQNERTARPVDFNTLDVKHGSSFHTSDGREGEPWARRREASSNCREKASGDPAMAFVRPSMASAAAPCRRVSFTSASSAAIQAGRSGNGNAPRRSCSDSRAGCGAGSPA